MMRTLLTLFFVTLSAPVWAADPLVMKIATVAPEGTPWSDGLKEFKNLVEKDSGGSLKVKLFLGGALGDENETVLSCKRGQIQGVGASVGALASQIPEMAILEMPYLFRNADEADHVLHNALSAKFAELFKKRGLMLGFWSENGFRSLGMSKNPVRSADDLKGKKMRSQEQPVHLSMWRAFGASPTPIPITETLTALQTGVVDGYDTTVLYAQAAALTSATKYYTMSEHIYQPAVIAFNQAFYDALNDTQKQAVQKAGTAVQDRIIREVRAMGPLLEKNLKAFGIEVIHLDAAAREKFEKMGATARTAYLQKASASEKELSKDIESALKSFRTTAKK